MKKRGCEYTTCAFRLVKRKDGASHIEMILAFVLFASAVGFGLYFLNPVNPERLTDTTMDYIYREIYKNASVGVESFSVKIHEITNGADVQINVGEIGERKVRVEDMNGAKIESAFFDDLIYIKDIVNGDSNGDYLVLVKLCEDLPEMSSAEPKEKGTATVASSNYEEVFSERRMILLNNSYYSNYSGLKEEFNIPDRTDFGFELVFSESDFIKSEMEIPQSLEVFSTVRRIEILRTDGRTVFAEIIIKLW